MTETAVAPATPTVAKGPDELWQRKPIGSRGSRQAKIVIIGEAPGKDEAERGIPFVGASGQELDRMLVDAGIYKTDAKGQILNKDDVFFTNVTLIRPPNNDINEWVQKTPTFKKPSKSVKKPTPNHYVPHRGWWVEPHVRRDAELLVEDLKEIKPNVVICLGQTPFWALCREGAEGKIGTWRGSTLVSDVIPGLKVVPAYHPAFILRVWEHRRITVQDFRRAKAASASPELSPPGWDFLTAPTFEATCSFLTELLERLEKGEVPFTCDIEGAQNKTLCVGIGVSAKRAICIPFHHKGGFYFTPDQHYVVVRLLHKVLTHPNARVVNQNINFDTQYLIQDFLIYPNIFWDTMVGQNVLFPGTPMNLAYQASMYCKQYRYWKDDSEEFWKVKKIKNWEEIWFYNCEDCVRTYEVFERQRESLPARKLMPQFNFLMNKVSPVMRKAMFRGVQVDAKLKAIYYKELLKVSYFAEQRVNLLTTRNLNVRSPQQLADFFYKELKMKPVESLKTGNPTTDADAMVELATRDPLVREVCRWINLVRSYQSGLKVAKSATEPNGRWQCLYSLGIAETYRLSSKENPFGRGLNLMNLTKGKEVKGNASLDEDDDE
jgi:uracil-DNA glycosylase